MKKEQNKINRRSFIETGAKATALSLASPLVGLGARSMDKKRKLALVGTGSRGTFLWGKKLLDGYGRYVDLVGLCDINLKRAQFSQQYIGAKTPVYHADEFDRMIAETQPDAVIVATTDSFHEKYIVRAMHLGCDVICEKPLTTEAEQCQNILLTEQKTGKKIITTFNARYGNDAEEIRRIIMSGELGRIISAEFHEYLDTIHGASYFRRWNGRIKYSGSLLVHKASHHFDQMNWWLDAEPETVHAFGDVAFYGKNHSFRSRKCRGCPFQQKCDFYWDITKNKKAMQMYVNCEDEDGYVRDSCVWDNEIDSYDTMTVQVRYNNGTLLNYSLNAFMPYEGQRIAFNGEKGRLDVRIYSRQPWQTENKNEFRLTKNFQNTKTWSVQIGKGGHGGADSALLDMLFLPSQSDPLGKLAGSRAGVLASLMGIAARTSIETGNIVRIDDLIEFPLRWRW